MNITVVDNLVQRLIQQGANERRPNVRPGGHAGRDTVELSHAAKQAGQAASAAKVEAKLMQLYGPRKT